MSSKQCNGISAKNWPSSIAPQGTWSVRLKLAAMFLEWVCPIFYALYVLYVWSSCCSCILLVWWFWKLFFWHIRALWRIWMHFAASFKLWWWSHAILKTHVTTNLFYGFQLVDQLDMTVYTIVFNYLFNEVGILF